MIKLENDERCCIFFAWVDFIDVCLWKFSNKAGTR